MPGPDPHVVAAAWLTAAEVRFVTGWVNPQVAWHCGQHQHAEHELVVHPKGRGVSGLADGRELAFAPGDVLWYPPGVAHDQRQSAAGENWCVHFTSAASSPVAPCAVALATDAGLLADLHTLARSGRPRSALGQLRADRLVQAALAGILEHHFSVPDADQPGAQPAHALHRHLAQHFTGPGRLGDFAGRHGLSSDHLRLCFTRQYGMSPMRWLTQLRLARAQELLRRSDLDLAGIAHGCGFATARYFCEVFRRELGCTPGAFRRRHGEG